MSKIFVIMKKELRDYFGSPIAGVSLFVTFVIFNIFFYMIVDQEGEATLRDIFKVMEFMFIFIIPIFTMKLFSEEKQNGTMEFLMTTPTTNTQIVLGKYLGSLVFFSVFILLSSIYYIILEMYSDPDKIAILSGYLGLWIQSAFFIAVGMLLSSWSKSQIVAAISSYVVLFLFYFSLSFEQYVNEWVGLMIRCVGAAWHAENFMVGMIHLSDIVYFLTGIFFCITLTRLSIENRLWR